MKSAGNIFILLLLPVLWNIAFIQWSINTRDEVPLSKAEIPETTLAFLDSIANRMFGGMDHLIIHKVDSLETDSWNNRNDFGQKDSNGFYVYEPDSLFVIYSDTNDGELFLKVHQYSKAAIPHMEEVMGHYVYPYMVKGRKLALYVCSDEDNYQKLCRRMGSPDNDYSNTWGLCVYRYSGVEVQTLGLPINYGSMKRISSNPDVDLNATIWHEMNHYVYFQSIDLSSELSMHTWMYEGLAEYFSSRIKKQTKYLKAEEKRAVYTNHLDSSFNPFSFNYSGGELFYEYLESKKGKQAVYSFIQSIYNTPLQNSLNNFGLNVQSAEQGWQSYIKKNYI